MPTSTRIQIIKSDETSREVLAAHLRDCGYTVTTCGDLETGLTQEAAIDFDFVLVDHALAVAHLGRDLQHEHLQLSEQKRVLELEREQLRESTRDLHVLHAFSSAVCSTLDLNTIITRISTELSKVIPHDLCALTLLHASQVQLHFYATVPVTHHLIEQAVDACITAAPHRLGRQVNKENLLYQVNGRMAFGDAQQQPGLTLTSAAQIAAPIVMARQTLGLIELYRLAEEPFTTAQERVLALLTTPVALALRNAYEYQKTQELALRDGLTRLYNHAAFQDFLEREFETFRRYNRPLALIMFDIDHFKVINDTYGHQAGDSILQELAALGDASVRKTDLLARYGGEEFVLILPDTDLTRAQLLADRLWKKIQEHQFMQSATVLSITVSLGVASTDTRGAFCPEDLIRAADMALYQAKEAGRNRWCVADGMDAFHGPQDFPPAASDTTLANR